MSQPVVEMGEGLAVAGGLSLTQLGRDGLHCENNWERPVVPASPAFLSLHFSVPAFFILVLLLSPLQFVFRDSEHLPQSTLELPVLLRWRRIGIEFRLHALIISQCEGLFAEIAVPW